jgi:hypothetical protein
VADPSAPDDELEAAVEAEWQTENEAALRADHFTLPSSRESIRKRLMQERKEAQDAEEQRLRVELLRRQLALQDEPEEGDDLLGGLAYMKADYEAAGKLHKAGKMTVDGIKTRRELSTKRAYRIYRQYVANAVLYDDVGLHPGPGYRWDPAGLDHDPPQYKLIPA